jgi:hypothetical protein
MTVVSPFTAPVWTLPSPLSIGLPPVWGASYHRDRVPARGPVLEWENDGVNVVLAPPLHTRVAAMLADPDGNSVTIDDARRELGFTGLPLVDYGASMSVRFYCSGFSPLLTLRPGVVQELQRSLEHVAHGIGAHARFLLHQWQRSIAALAAVDDDGHAVVRGAFVGTPGLIGEVAFTPRVWTVREGLPTSVYFQRSGGVLRVLALGLSPDWTGLLNRVTTPSGAARRPGEYAPPAPPWTPPVYGLDITGE